MNNFNDTGVQPIAPIAPIAQIAPLNTNPTPMAAFGMGQTIPGAVPMMQPFTGGVVPPMAAVPGVVPSIPSSTFSLFFLAYQYV